ncbi:MAG: hypothetical protein JW902_16760 [Syntrophaceae bacterium]|nr:hypothetical protein [Syntrophaceae bacterium]
MKEGLCIRSWFCIALGMIIHYHGLTGNDIVKSNQTMTLQEKRAVLKGHQISESKLEKHSGFSAIEMKGHTDIRAMVMGDGKAPLDWAQGGTISTYKIGNKLLGSIGARVRAKFYIVNMVDRVTLSLNVIRDGNTPMLLTPVIKDITAPGTYTLEVNKEFSLESDHTYEAQALIEVGQPKSNQVRAVAGIVVKVEWLY